MATLAVTRELVDKVVCSSYVTHQGLALLTLSWDKNWDSHSLVNGYPSFYPRIALVAPSPEGHKLLLNTRNNSGLLAIGIDKLHDRFDRQKRSWNLSVSLASDPTRSGPSFGRNSSQVGRKSVDGIVCHSARS